MARCPLCSTRSAKRYCPAKAIEASICATCCGEQREIEIDCPSSCSYLKAARAYEAEWLPPPPGFDATGSERYDQLFLAKYALPLNALSYAVVMERRESPGLTDLDAIETYKALQATMKTLDSGLFYESLPEGGFRVALFARLKAVLDETMTPQAESGRAALRPAEAVDILGFMIFSSSLECGQRPKSRRYLDWLTAQASSILGSQESAPSSAGSGDPSRRIVLP